MIACGNCLGKGTSRSRICHMCGGTGQLHRLPSPDDAVTVERMAQAIFYSSRSAAEGIAYPWETRYEFVRESYRNQAIAALRALWEVTPCPKP